MDVPSDEPMGGYLHRGPSDPFSLQFFLDSFIPGYGPAYKVIIDTFGYDATALICLCAAFWLLAKICRPAAIDTFFRKYYMSEISVSSEDAIFDHLISLFARQDKTHHRKLRAETLWRSTWDIGHEEARSLELTDEAKRSTPWLNFSDEGAMSEPQFTPGTGLHKFWHKGTYFELGRKEQTRLDMTGGGGLTLGDTQRLTLSCWGRSPDPIKELIQHAKKQYYLQYSAKTVVKHPAMRDMYRYNNKSCWATVAERPCRPIENIVLDKGRKIQVLQDINEYLSPATARWYAKRGIPYRRGYLFHGPAGTGKTSLTFAIAGVFGLEIYVISLLDPNITEEYLRTLFNDLPARCIVLFEDIDTAGLVRDIEENSSQQTNTAVNNELNVAILASAIKKEQRPSISLSSLLNVIDGVASHEGRVLVMTTNHVNKLDEALIRPGRIDFEVAFSNATKIQVRELFERMYANDLVPFISGHSALNNTIVNEAGEEVKNTCLASEELSVAALEFAEQVPDAVFSPAEVQGFLIKRKNGHRKAIEDVGAWVKEMLAKKNSGSKLVQIE